MQNSHDLQQVLDLRRSLAEGDEKRLKEQRDAGKQTARERIEKLVDAGSFVELYALVSEDGVGAGVVTGYGTVQDRPVYAFAQDFTVHGGAMGKAQAQKICKLLDLALKTGAPVIALSDSAGVRIDEGAGAMSAYSEIYQRMARMSGVCPMISVVLGPCVGGAALMAQLADVCVMARNVGSLMMFGPQVLAAMNGKDVKVEQVGGADMMAAQGGCAIVARDEADALAKAAQLLALLPGCNAEDAELLDGDDLNRVLPAIDPSDVDTLVGSVLDAGTGIELYAEYESSIRVLMGRLGGHSVGVVATAQGKDDGKLTAGALQKAARFVRFMDCFNLPVISLINTKGVYVTDLNTQSWLMRAQSQLLYAYAEATVPKLAVVTGDAIGQAYVAMGGKANADVSYAWPGAVISALSPEAAVAVLYADQVKADKTLSPDQARAKYAEEYVKNVAGAIEAAKAGLVDDVIDPAQTRQLLIAALEMLFSKRDSNPPKKHGNLPL
ncbi:MAG: carboxyl transferase domain-containing protein [Eubacteriales bacterium]|nr:carboxyl transferase domain-containing protein [Eubacteriales bacterium]